MKNASKLSQLLASDSILLKTGNVVGLNALNKNVGQSVSEEVSLNVLKLFFIFTEFVLEMNKMKKFLDRNMLEFDDR